MNLIEKFENMPFQDVGTFNSIFKNSPILGFDFGTEVEIGGIANDNQRKIIVGETTLFLDLTQKSQKEVRRAEKKERKLEKVASNLEAKLPVIYSMLTPTEFMTYLAIKQLGEVDGLCALSRTLPVSAKTIYNCLPKLTKLGLVRKKKVTTGKKSFIRLIDTRKVLD